MVLVSTGDEYCRRTDAALGHLPRLHRVVDDMLAEADDLTTCNSDARLLLTTCRENNITLSKKKFNFAASNANFTGYVISHQSSPSLYVPSTISPSCIIRNTHLVNITRPTAEQWSSRSNM